MATMGGRPRYAADSRGIATQISPPPSLIMRFTADAVAFWAATTRSPSFSRSMLSRTMTMRPRRMSARACSMVDAFI
jgi:hypothetical protein